MDALSPSNWAATNPEVLRKGQESMGQTWLKGFESYTRDMQAMRQARTDANPDTLAELDFVVGKQVAITPGKVVFRNHLIELIQYTPMTKTVFPEPLLIIPSCIMKYYILAALDPRIPWVRYLVGKGHTVFIVSWRNPDASDRELGMQDYLQLGVVDAMAAVKTATGCRAYPQPGRPPGRYLPSIIASALGRRAQLNRGAKGKAAMPHRRQEDHAAFDELPELASVTLLAAQTDFTEPGELGVFIDDDQLKTLREDMAEKGYLSGKQMAGSFQFLNSRDLIWSRNTRRYLLGQDEVGNDMMSWNADLRLPERMHSVPVVVVPEQCAGKRA